MAAKVLLTILISTGFFMYSNLSVAAENILNGRNICIDPGHPSETSAGTKGQSGLTENHVNWLVAQRLSIRLRRMASKVKLTKHEEMEKVTNRKRAEIANDMKADILIRLHCDAGSKSGFCIFYPDRQGKRFGITGPSEEVIKDSKLAAQTFYPAMEKTLKGRLSGLGILGDSKTYVGSKQGALTGSIFSKVPTLTIEMCVLTNKNDERFISSPVGQRKMVDALCNGLKAYFTFLTKSEE